MLNKEEIKILTESMVEAAQIGSLNALTLIKKSFEALKVLEIPIVDRDGKVKEYTKPNPEQMVEFMIVFFDEAIKTLEKEVNKTLEKEVNKK